MKRSRYLFWMFSGLILLATHAWAARFAEIDIAGTEIYDSITPKRKVISRLEKGTFVVAGSNPVLGFFKVRLRDQTVGWVRAEALKFSGTVLAQDQDMGVSGGSTASAGGMAVGGGQVLPSMNVEVMLTDRLSENLKKWQEMRDTPLSHPFWRR